MTDTEKTSDLSGSENLPRVLLMAHDEIRALLDSLRASRDIIHRTNVSRLRHTSAKLQEVTDVTELATTGILRGLEKSISLVDELGKLDGSENESAVTARTLLKEELYQAQTALQFQDITAQQLRYVSSVLLDMEERMEGLAQVLDPDNAFSEQSITDQTPSSGILDDVRHSGPGNFDPGATMKDAKRRQALADAIFTDSQ